MLAPSPININPREFAKFLDRTKRTGFMALLMHPSSCPKGFALFYARVTRWTHPKEPNVLTTVLLTADSIVTKLVADVSAERLSHARVEGALMEEVRRFDVLAGGSVLFRGGLHLPMLLVNDEDPVPREQIPDFGKFAAARIYQKFYEPLPETEFPVVARRSLLELLGGIIAPDALWTDPAC